MSSYLNYYKHGGLLINPPNLVQVSNESFIGKVGDGLKRLLKYITDFFKKVFTWIKNKINNVLKSRVFRIKIEKIKRRLKVTKVIISDDNVFREVLKESILTVSNSKSLENYKDELKEHYLQYGIDFSQYLFNPDNGKLFDLDQRINKCENYIKRSIDAINAGFSTNIDNIIVKNLMSVNGNYGDYGLSDLTNTLSMVTFDDLYKYVNNIDNLIEQCEKFSNKYKPSLEKEIKLISKLIEGNQEDASQLVSKLNALNIVIKMVTIPLNTMLMYCNLLSVVDESFHSEKYTTVPVDPSQQLYHLSLDDNLGKESKVLYPELSKNSLTEYLPKRVSFSPSIASCVPGIHHHLTPPDRVENGVYIKENVYVYIGVTDTNTRRLKDELLSLTLSDYLYTKEICITTPIKIRKLSKIRLYYKPDNKSSYSYVNHEEVS